MGRAPGTVAAAAIAAVFVCACSGDQANPGCDDPLLIDDMEDNDRFICATSGRTGTWFTADDGTSTNISPRGEFTQSEIPGGRGGSRHAAHMTGFGFTGWGAAMGFLLNGAGNQAQSYDASAAGGVRFWMKSNVPVSVTLQTPETLRAEFGGRCVDEGTTWNCDNHFWFSIQPPTSSEWVQYDVPYAALTQQFLIGAEGARMGSASWNPSELVNIQFSVDPWQTFDVWIDDVRFYSCSADECVPTCTNAALPLACPATGASPASCRPAGTNCAKALTATLSGVWGFAADDVWAGGEGTFLHWNGSAWSAVPSGTTDRLSIRWGSAPDDIWAVGVHGALAHWNGSTWSPVASGTDRDLFGVWGSGRDDVWATGAAGTILHWDGSSWSPVSSGTAYRLWRAWGSGRDDVWAVGMSETTGPFGVIVHWNGSTWSPIFERHAASDGRVGKWTQRRLDRRPRRQHPPLERLRVVRGSERYIDAAAHRGGKWAGRRLGRRPRGHAAPLERLGMVTGSDREIDQP